MGRRNPFWILLTSVILISIFQIGYVIGAVDFSPAAEVLLSFSLIYAFILWVVADARYRGGIPCYDFGFLVLLFFPISLAWYVIRSQGRWGLLTLLILFGLMLTPSLTAVVAWYVLYGRD